MFQPDREPANIMQAIHRQSALDRFFVKGETAISENDRSWIHATVTLNVDRLKGVASDSVPTEWYQVLRWVGIPLCPNGGVRFGETLTVDEQASIISLQHEVCSLPPVDVLASLNGPQLRPLRQWIAERFAVRLQAPPRVSFTLCDDAAFVMSAQPVAVAGFIHGPRQGQRSSMYLESGGHQLLRLT